MFSFDMYKNQLQELAQRSCFNLPSYACVREGPDHAPRFKASVNFNGEVFQGPSQCTTLRQAEHAAAEVALTSLSSRAPSRSLAARVLDETGVYKNLLQETTHRAGLKLPIYTTVRSGPGHQPVFTSTVELAGMCIAGEPAKTKKQAEKNAAMAAWSSLKQMPDIDSLTRARDEGEVGGDGGGGGGGGGGEEQEQLVRYLSNFKPNEENKKARQKELYQQQLQKQRRNPVGFNDGVSAAPLHRPSRFHQQWKSLNPLSDSSLTNSSPHHQKQSSFLVSALSTGPQPLSSLPFSSKERLNNHLTHTSPHTIPSCSAALPLLFTDPKALAFATQALSPSRLSISIEAAPARNSHFIAVPRTLNTGGFHGRGIAPAVQIRSVIPVCAAPPVRKPEATAFSPSGGYPVLIPNQKTDTEISAATSKLNKLQL